MSIEQAIKMAYPEAKFPITPHWTIERHLLSSDFWRRLGKAMGWEYFKLTEDYYAFIDDDNHRRYHGEIKRREWLFEWHRFIDHLAEGKDAESFFRTLEE